MTITLTDEERSLALYVLDLHWHRLDRERPPYPDDRLFIERQQRLAHLMSKLRHAD